MNNTYNVYNADEILSQIIEEPWIIKNAYNDRLARLLELIQEEIDRRDWEVLDKMILPTGGK